MSVIHSAITYSLIPGFRPLLLDLHIPDEVATPPIVVWMHGGAYINGDRRFLPDTFPINSVWDALGAAGIACATIDYRLVGEAIWPAQATDLAAAVAYLRDHAAEWDIDGSCVGLAGESAGGHLALMGGLEIPDIRAVAALYPLTEPLELDPLPPDMPDVFGGDRELARTASPVLRVTATMPPCLFVHGDADALLPLAQSATMHGRLVAAGVESTLRVVPGADHCFAGYPDTAGLLTDMAAWLAAHL